jgi:hypothetical protein
LFTQAKTSIAQNLGKKSWPEPPGRLFESLTVVPLNDAVSDSSADFFINALPWQA